MTKLMFDRLRKIARNVIVADGYANNGSKSACVDKSVDAYFTTGKIPATDQNCELSTALYFTYS
jgi:hypothetical protein